MSIRKITFRRAELKRYTGLLASFALYFILVSATYRWAVSWGFEAIAALQTAGLIVTGVILIWYTWETRQLGLEARRQTELQIKPFVVLDVQNASDDGTFVLKNIGNGAAINVGIKDIEVVPGHNDIVVRFTDLPRFLGRGDAAPIRPNSLVEGKPISVRDFFVSNIRPEYANQEISFEITFQDAEFRTHVVEQRVLPERLEITGFEVKR
jgi:hypothetical protein